MLKTPIKVQKTDILAGHKDCVYSLANCSDDTIIFSADGMGTIAEWQLKNPDMGRILAQVTNSVYAMAYWAEKNTLLIGQNFEGLHLINLTIRKEIASFKITNAAIFDIKIWHPYAFIACADGVVIVFDLHNLAVRKHLKASDKSARCIALSPQNEEFAVGYSDNYIRVFDLKSLALKYATEAHANSVFCLNYSPDENFLLSGSRDAHLKIWLPEQQYQLHQDIVAHLFAINHIAYSPDKAYFATCSMDKSIKIWEGATFKLLKVIDKARHAGHGTSVNKLLWTNHQNKLLSASDDKMIAIWEFA